MAGLPLFIFANELWQLDPTKDYLIMLFPQGFWYDAALFCAVATAAGAITLAGIAGVIYYLPEAGLYPICDDIRLRRTCVLGKDTSKFYPSKKD